MSIHDSRVGIDTIDEMIKALPRHYPTHHSVGDRLEDEVTARILRNATTTQTQLPGFWTFVDLMRRRAKFVGQVCEDKRALGLHSGFDAERERAVLERMQDSPFYRLFEIAVTYFRDAQDYELKPEGVKATDKEKKEKLRDVMDKTLDTDLIDGIMDFNGEDSAAETLVSCTNMLCYVFGKESLYNVGMCVTHVCAKENKPLHMISRSMRKSDIAKAIVIMTRSILA